MNTACALRYYFLRLVCNEHNGTECKHAMESDRLGNSKYQKWDCDGSGKISVRIGRIGIPKQKPVTKHK